MNTHTLLFFLLSFALVACKPDPEPIPNDGGQNNDTVEIIVKKYLVREYYEMFPDEPLLVIEWNEDFTKTTHITTYKNNSYQLDYSFEYFGNDSMRVVLSKPVDSWALVYFTEYICHFDESGKISTIDYYVNSEKSVSEKYNYDLSSKLVSIVEKEQDAPCWHFFWDGDNVCEVKIPSGETLYNYTAFTDYYHPYYTLPYLLRSGDGYHSMFLTKPLWKNWYTNNSSGARYEVDEDGYVNHAYFITEEGDTNSRICYEYLK